MNNEIKEILGNLKEWSVDGNLYFEINDEKAKKLYNYITNLQQVNKNQAKRNSRQRLANQKQQELILKLQQENETRQQDINNLIYQLAKMKEESERLKENLQQEKKDFKEANDYCFELKDYKSRCEKAVKYNNQIIKDTKDFYRPTTDIIYSGDSLIEIATNNINILQNGSDSK